MKNIIEGKNAFIEAYKAQVKFKKIYKLPDLKNDVLNKIIYDLEKKGIVIENVSRNFLDKISETKTHKGIIAETYEYKYYTIDDIIMYAKTKNEFPFFFILDEIEDPRNFGAIIRSAYAFGVHGIIIKEKNAVAVTSTVISASTGTANHMRIVKVNNITKTIEKLKKENIWFYEAAMNGDNIYDINFDGGICVVVGNEGKGVSRLVSENCDFKIKIPMYNDLDSLNVSVASSIIMYEISKQRKIINV